MRKKRYWAAFTNFNMRGCDRDNDLNKLRQRVKARMQYPTDHYEIFRDQPGFHSTTQQEYLVEHCNDDYWLSKGVPSA